MKKLKYHFEQRFTHLTWDAKWTYGQTLNGGNFLSTEHLAAFNTMNTLTIIIKIPHKYECFWFPMVLTTTYTYIYESILNNSDKEWWNCKIKKIISILGKTNMYMHIFFYAK